MPPPVLSATGITKRYGRTVALGGVDLHLDAGELVGLLGPNGAGKSTLTKIACGLVRASADFRRGRVFASVRPFLASCGDRGGSQRTITGRLLVPTRDRWSAAW